MIAIPKHALNTGYVVSIKDEVARLRAEARHYRDLARQQRERIRDLTTGPVGSRDMLAALKARERVNEYVRAAQDRDAKLKELRHVYNR